MKITLLISIFIYFLILASMYIFQRKIMYLPLKGEPNIKSIVGIEKIFLTTKDNVKITALYTQQKESKPLIVYFHGNASNVTADYRVYRFNKFIEAGYGLLAVSYRGYADSEGSPSEEGLYNDARAAIEYLLNEKKLKRNKIVLFGESLGSGVAVQMATEYSFKAIMLDSPYTSTVNRAEELYPFLPIEFLMKDKFESFKKISNIHKMKVIIFHGYEDEVIPIEHGRKMFSLANEPKTAHFQEGVTHVETPMDIILEELNLLNEIE